MVLDRVDHLCEESVEGHQRPGLPPRRPLVADRLLLDPPHPGRRVHGLRHGHRHHRPPRPPRPPPHRGHHPPRPVPDTRRKVSPLSHATPG
ncbi:hypothetical protein SBRY_10375 [Actinacidiphila bryophytorum]|uniref:Uncharacterized protein n=1 Tax=Actinacidiphila bryophytorum TaxID=1436133 RepID=A0A9W4E178_9ACTN|nr:hypothetical protein SBRY_10375 [Actinacidiphila bryophytorum]